MVLGHKSSELFFVLGSLGDLKGVSEDVFGSTDSIGSY